MEGSTRYACAHCNEPHAWPEKYVAVDGASLCSPECLYQHLRELGDGGGDEVRMQQRFGRQVLAAPTRWWLRRTGERRANWMPRCRTPLCEADRIRAAQQDADAGDGGLARRTH